MSRSIYLVNPRSDFPTYFSTEVYGGRGSPNERALVGNVQTSRGCPFECEFCDVIQYLGRKQRHKSVAQVLAELDEVYRRGYRTVFLSDDNFTVYRSRAKELLVALRDWNRRREDGSVDFLTQVSIDAAKDPELLGLCAEAGLTRVFIGIETPNADGLRETKKRQNLHVDLAQQVERFVEHGILVAGGMIVGFDADGPDIFARQLEFAMAVPVPVFSVGALVAPDATPLHARMAAAGRLVTDGSEAIAVPWNTNLVPKRMTRRELLAGLQTLCRQLYDPGAFGERVLRFIAALGPRRDPRAAEALTGRARLRPIDGESLELLAQLPRLGPEEARLWSAVRAALVRKPAATDLVIPLLLQYLQIRYMYDFGNFWKADSAPVAGSAGV